MSWEYQLVSESLNGVPVDLALNAKYRAIPDGNRVKRGSFVSKVCRDAGCRYARVKGREVFMARDGGTLLSACLADKLVEWELKDKDYLLVVPLDRNVYAVNVGSFGTVEYGTERIVEPSELMGLTDGVKTAFVGGGKLTEEVGLTQGEISAGDLKPYALRRVRSELIAGGMVTRSALIRSGIAATAVAAIAVLFTGLQSGEDESGVLGAVSEITRPRGTDVASYQLDQIAGAVSELEYFVAKGLQTVVFENGVLSIRGNFPPVEELRELEADAARAGVALVIDQDGWQLNYALELPARTPFDLGSFNDVWMALQEAAQRESVALSLGAPEVSGQRRSAPAQVIIENRDPPIQAIARAVRGHGAVLQGYQMEYGPDGRPASTLITIQLVGVQGE